MDINKIKDFIPIATFLIIVCSVTKLITFYNYFNINIIEYITLPEIIFSFTEDIYNFIKVIITYVIWWLIDDVVLAYRQKETIEDSGVNSVRLFIRNLILIQVTIQLIGTIIGSIWEPKIGYLTNILLVYLSIIYIYIKGPSYQIYAKYLGILIVFFFLNMSGAQLKAENLEQGQSNKVVSLKYQNELIVSDSINVYLGKTNNYSFFYNRHNKITTIYNNSEIKMMQIQKKN